MESYKFVVDTNTVVSRLLLPESIPAKAFRRAIERGDLVFSLATLGELDEVLRRPKFDRYLSVEERAKFFKLLARIGIVVDILHEITECRDPKDNKFLEVAVSGKVDAIISGDADLLALNPFREIPILSPRQFLEKENGG